MIESPAKSMVMLDPSAYIITRDDRYPTISNAGETLYARTSNLTLPSGL